jgi:hypothetical protein
MPQKTYTCRDVHIEYEDVRELRAKHKLKLGLPEMLASAMSSKGFDSSSPEIKGIRSSFFFFTWAPVVGFAWSIYYSAVGGGAWWSFVLAFIVMISIQKVNRTSNVTNICDAACRDKNLYDEIKAENCWLYQMDEPTAVAYAFAQMARSGQPTHIFDAPVRVE